MSTITTSLPPSDYGRKDLRRITTIASTGAYLWVIADCGNQGADSWMRTTILGFQGALPKQQDAPECVEEAEILEAMGNLVYPVANASVAVAPGARYAEFPWVQYFLNDGIILVHQSGGRDV